MGSRVPIIPNQQDMIAYLAGAIDDRPGRRKGRGLLEARLPGMLQTAPFSRVRL